MNNTIKELAEQIGYKSVNPPTYVGNDLQDIFLEKFALSIVNQCVDIVEGGKFLHDQAPSALFAKECSSAIKRYFEIK